MLIRAVVNLHTDPKFHPSYSTISNHLPLHGLHIPCLWVAYLYMSFKLPMILKFPRMIVTSTNFQGINIWKTVSLRNLVFPRTEICDYVRLVLYILLKTSRNKHKNSIFVDESKCSTKKRNLSQSYSLLKMQSKNNGDLLLHNLPLSYIRQCNIEEQYWSIISYMSHLRDKMG